MSPKLNDKDDPAKVQLHLHFLTILVNPRHIFCQVIPRFGNKTDRRHVLYKCHQAAFFDKKHPRKTPDSLKIDLDAMENQCLEDICKALKDATAIVDAETLFKDAVDAEIKIYKY